VPYRGSAPLLPDLLNGQVPLAFDTLPQYVEHFGAGRLRGLAISGARRAPSAPGVASAPEAGFPDCSPRTGSGISGPAGLPAEVVPSCTRPRSALWTART
jgi:tripartite-type tricarboxylate transporter receptor subunit TctC